DRAARCHCDEEKKNPVQLFLKCHLDLLRICRASFRRPVDRRARREMLAKAQSAHGMKLGEKGALAATATATAGPPGGKRTQPHMGRNPMVPSKWLKWVLA